MRLLRLDHKLENIDLTEVKKHFDIVDILQIGKYSLVLTATRNSRKYVLKVFDLTNRVLEPVDMHKRNVTKGDQVYMAQGIYAGQWGTFVKYNGKNLKIMLSDNWTIYPSPNSVKVSKISDLASGTHRLSFEVDFTR
jgi:hypothetical protein